MNTDQIHRVSVKLPPFWAEKPSLWFAQADSQFTISGITNEDTKFHYIVSQLDTRFAAEVEDLIINPPAEDKYKTLKAKLIERLSATEEQRVRQLLNDEELGDRKPSQFLRHLQSLAGSAFPQDNNLLRQLWLRRLPSSTQAILAAQSEMSLDKLADLADKITEVTQSPSSFAINASSSPSYDSLLEKIDALSKQVAQLSTLIPSRRPRSSSKAKSTDRARDSSKAKLKEAGWCWYHTKFQKNASKCIPPCSFQENSPSNL